MRMKIDSKKVTIFLTLFALVAIAAVPMVQSRLTYYSFEIVLPTQVDATPGQDAIVQGGVLVTGAYWLHDFNLTVNGIPYEYSITPKNPWDMVRILRDWNPVQGLFRTADPFNITIHVPANAAGSYIVLVSGAEHRSARQATNSSYFVLKVAGAPLAPQLSVSDILVPETINELEPFTMSFKVDNAAPIDTAATITVKLPDDWKADTTSKTVSLKAGSSTAEQFIIVPTSSAGSVSLLIEYPFMNSIVNFTKEGPYLVPGGENQTAPTNQTSPFSIVGNIVAYVKSISAGSLSPILISLIIILLVIIVWLSLGIYNTMTGKGDKGEPEKMEKSDKPKGGETKTKTSSVSLAEV
jgi:hypothetical protein